MLKIAAAAHKRYFVHNYFCSAKRNLLYCIFCAEIALLDSIILCAGQLRKITYFVRSMAKNELANHTKILLRRTK